MKIILTIQVWYFNGVAMEMKENIIISLSNKKENLVS